jgi:hypothetical protein
MVAQAGIHACVLRPPHFSGKNQNRCNLFQISLFINVLDNIHKGQLQPSNDDDDNLWFI